MCVPRNRRLYRLLSIVAPLTLTAIGCDPSGIPTGTMGGDPFTTSSGSTSMSVTVRNNAFDPSASSVALGATVTWIWAQGADAHNVTFDDGPKSDTQSRGTFARIFTTTGTFPYHCTVHPGMNGSVTVR